MKENNNSMKISFMYGTQKVMNDNFDSIPNGALCFCEDVGKIYLKIDNESIDMTDNIEIIDPLDDIEEEDNNE